METFDEVALGVILWDVIKIGFALLAAFVLTVLVVGVSLVLWLNFGERRTGG